MKILSILFLSILLSSSVFADAKIGVGFSYSPAPAAVESLSNIVKVNPPKLLVPIIMNNFRAEFKLSVFNISVERDKETDSLFFGDIGLGIYKIINISKKLNIIIGGEFSTVIISDDKDQYSDVSSFSVGVSSGIEYMILPDFTVSADIILDYIRYSNDSSTYNFITTTSTISVRWYF